MKLKWNTDKPENIQEYYLVTTKRGEIIISLWTDISRYGGFVTDWHWENGVHRPYPEDEPIAWMPLPEPYVDPDKNKAKIKIDKCLFFDRVYYYAKMVNGLLVASNKSYDKLVDDIIAKGYKEENIIW